MMFGFGPSFPACVDHTAQFNAMSRKNVVTTAMTISTTRIFYVFSVVLVF